MPCTCGHVNCADSGDRRAQILERLETTLSAAAWRVMEEADYGGPFNSLWDEVQEAVCNLLVDQVHAAYREGQEDAQSDFEAVLDCISEESS